LPISIQASTKKESSTFNSLKNKPNPKNYNKNNKTKSNNQNSEKTTKMSQIMAIPLTILKTHLSQKQLNKNPGYNKVGD
jgi:hypothetical protein